MGSLLARFLTKPLPTLEDDAKELLSLDRSSELGPLGLQGILDSLLDLNDAHQLVYLNCDDRFDAKGVKIQDLKLRHGVYLYRERSRNPFRSHTWNYYFRVNR